MTHTSQKGFTLLETLVAVFILTLALTGPIYIATLAIQSSVESRDNVSAYYLAEEAIEAIRNKRDEISFNNTTNPSAWLYHLTGDAICTNPASSVNATCYMTRETTGNYKFTACTGDCPPLSFNPNGSIVYGEDAVTSTQVSKFSREIYLQTGAQDSSTNENPDREVNVVVTIRWDDHGRAREYKLTDRLYNQQYVRYYNH